MKLPVPFISRENPFEHLECLLKEKDQYVEFAIGEYFYSILYGFHDCDRIIVWLNDNLVEERNTIVEEIMKYIIHRNIHDWRDDINFWSFCMFNICCKLNFDQTKHLYESQEEIAYRGKYIYEMMLQFHEMKRKLKDLQK